MSAHPETALSVQVKRYIKWAMPKNVQWTASLTGTNLDMRTATRAKAAGVRRGWPDWSFLCPDGITRFIELKSKTGSLTPEQREFRDACAPFGIFAVCRSVEEVEQALRGWGVKLRASVFAMEDGE